MAETVILLVVGLFCGMIPGFWLGRFSAKYYVRENEDGMSAETGEAVGKLRGVAEGVQDMTQSVVSDASSGEAGEAIRGRHMRENPRFDRRKEGADGTIVISSPVAGYIADCNDGKRPEIWLNPEGEKVYAPAGGKIIRMFPLGNEMLLRAEEGVVLRIKVGENVDELQGEYFRPKVIQNEVINRGKLLLEFDRKCLEAEGVECLVSVRVEELEPGMRVAGIGSGSVKVGEEILEMI